jgi:hypothetical protein
MNDTPRIQPGVGTIAFRYRSSFTLLTALSSKTVKGESSGYLTGILYLSPHTSGGGATLCPHSTEDCRAMCLAGAGLSGLPLQLEAKRRRTEYFNLSREAFLADLMRDIHKLKAICAKEGLKPAVRLNGTSDVLWERQAWPWSTLGVQRYDYTKVPLHMRHTDPGYHLTYSYMGPQDAPRARRYLANGFSVAVVVPPEVKDKLLSRPDHRWPMVDGDLTDLRFLDPPGSVVLLKPKGHVRTGLVRPNFLREFADATLEN